MGEKKEQKYKQWSTKHYEENLRSSNTHPNENRMNLFWVFWKGKQILFHIRNLSCFGCHKPSDKSKTRKESDYNYDKCNISVIICDTIFRKAKPSIGGERKMFEVIIST
jgi:hypothetical protein